MGIGSKSSQAKIEEFYFSRFKEQQALPQGKIIFGDKPDVVISGEKEVGIEITQLYNDPTGSEQKQIAVRQLVVEKAYKEFYETNKTNIEFWFGFEPNIPIKNVAKLASQIANLAGHLKNENPGRIPKEKFNGIPEIAFVHRGEIYDDCRWVSGQASVTPFLKVEHLIETIKKKEKKLGEYRKCDEFWLLIAINFMDLSQDQIIKQEMLKPIKSSFQKIFIYKTVTEEVFEVPLIVDLTR